MVQDRCLYVMTQGGGLFKFVPNGGASARLSKGGLPFDFMNLYDWTPVRLRKRVITDNAHLPLSEMRNAEDKTRPTQWGD